MYISKSYFLLKNHSIYMIMLFGCYIISSRSLIISCHSRISSNSHTVNTDLPKCSKK